jgi:hypothetical protein
MKGREALFSAAMEVAARPLVAGAKAEADARRVAARATYLTIVYCRCLLNY